MLSIFGLFLFSIFVTLAHGIVHHSGFLLSVEYHSLFWQLVVIAVPFVSVPAYCSALFLFAEDKFYGLLIAVPVPLAPVPACCGEGTICCGEETCLITDQKY